MKVFAVAFYECNVSLLNKRIDLFRFKNILTDPKLVNSSEQCFKNPLNSKINKWQVNIFLP